MYGFHRLFDEYLAHIAFVVSLVGHPQEIQPVGRLRIEVQPDLAALRQGDRLLLNDLPGRIDQLQHEITGLVAVELEQQAIGSRVGEGLITDVARSASAGIDDHDDGIADLPGRAYFFDPEIEFAHISRIKVVLILVFCRRTF
jgi:hypothetical protein